MNQRHLSLTHKEKETLRLLLQGYDAKSMAQHLGLSVHTINERLRDARRKMGTSSSREAARLLREAEARDPHLLGDKGFGDAARLPASQQERQPAQRRGTLRRAGWIVGGIVMPITAALLLRNPPQPPFPPLRPARQRQLLQRAHSLPFVIATTGAPAGKRLTNHSSCSTRLTGGPKPRGESAATSDRHDRASS